MGQEVLDFFLTCAKSCDKVVQWEASSDLCWPIEGQAWSVLSNERPRLICAYQWEVTTHPCCPMGGHNSICADQGHAWSVLSNGRPQLDLCCPMRGHDSSGLSNRRRQLICAVQWEAAFVIFTYWYECNQRAIDPWKYWGAPVPGGLDHYLEWNDPHCYPVHHSLPPGMTLLIHIDECFFYQESFLCHAGWESSRVNCVYHQTWQCDRLIFLLNLILGYSASWYGL